MRRVETEKRAGGKRGGGARGLRTRPAHRPEGGNGQCGPWQPMPGPEEGDGDGRWKEEGGRTPAIQRCRAWLISNPTVCRSKGRETTATDSPTENGLIALGREDLNRNVPRSGVTTSPTGAEVPDRPVERRSIATPVARFGSG